MSGIEFTRVKGAWNLPHLETLKLSDNQFFMHGMPDIFSEQGLSKVLNLKHLYLQNVTLGDKQFNEIVYDGGMNLKTLKVDQNVITLIYVVIHWKMPKLEAFSITENQLLSTAYLLADIMALNHLKYANLSRQNHLLILISSHQRHRRNIFTWKDKTELCCANPDSACSFGVPENLTLLDLSFSAFKLPTIQELVLMNNNTLHFLNLSSNAIQKLPKPFYCAQDIKPAITILDLSNNKIECITFSFFTHCNWSSLNILKLNQNQLSQRALGDCSGNVTDPLSFIKPLLNLTKLELSGNELNWEMNPKTFENQTNLEELLLSNMRIQNFTIKIGHMTKLRYLDISSNSIKCLSENTTKELKNLKLNSILEVNLQNNPLQCSCDCYSFLKWYKYTEIVFIGKNNLYCVSGKKKFRLSNISKVLMILDAACFPRTWLNMMIGVEVTACFTITIFVLYRRHKYRIYFFYLRCRVLFLSKMAAEEVKQFHAFISFALQDRQWVKRRLIKNLEKRRKLKLLVASRDFEPGKLITANIHDAITTSSKTVFVISKSFLKSSWYLGEFSMALTVSEDSMNLLSETFLKRSS